MPEQQPTPNTKPAFKIAHPRKRRSVPVSQMVFPQALHTQRRLIHAKVDQIAANFDPDAFGIPIVNLRDHVPPLLREGIPLRYRIVDGQHRVHGLKKWFGDGDPGSVECEVYEELSDQEEADLFLWINQVRSSVHVFDAFHIHCTAEHERESDIRRTVESNGLKISQAKDQGCIGAVSALTKVYDQGGPTILGQTLRAIRDAFGGDSLAFDRDLIKGQGMVFNRYNGRTNMEHLVDRLSQVPRGYRGVLQRAEATRERTGNLKVDCIAAAIVDIYNKGLRSPSQRLPSWWKGATDDDQ